MRGRRSLRHEGQFEMLDDPVHRGIVGNEGDDALRLCGIFPIPVADLTFSFIEGEAFQGKERANRLEPSAWQADVNSFTKR